MMRKFRGKENPEVYTLYNELLQTIDIECLLESVILFYDSQRQEYQSKSSISEIIVLAGKVQGVLRYEGYEV